MTRMRYIAHRRRRGAQRSRRCLGGEWQLDDHDAEYDHAEHNGAEHSAARLDCPNMGSSPGSSSSSGASYDASMSSL